jgi:hypothetical protein
MPKINDDETDVEEMESQEIEQNEEAAIETGVNGFAERRS